MKLEKWKKGGALTRRGFVRNALLGVAAAGGRSGSPSCFR